MKKEELEKIIKETKLPQGMNIAHLMAKEENLLMLEYLLENYEHLFTRRSGSGLNPIDYAIAYNKTKAIKLLYDPYVARLRKILSIKSIDLVKNTTKDIPVQIVKSESDPLKTKYNHTKKITLDTPQCVKDEIMESYKIDVDIEKYIVEDDSIDTNKSSISKTRKSKDIIKSELEKIRLKTNNYSNSKQDCWYYNGEVAIVHEGIGFVYNIFNITKNMNYIGLKHIKDCKYYCGSSTSLLKDICAGDRIIKIILKYCASENKLIEEEKKFQNKYSVLNNISFYNCAIEGCPINQGKAMRLGAERKNIKVVKSPTEQQKFAIKYLNKMNSSVNIHQIDKHNQDIKNNKKITINTKQTGFENWPNIDF